MPVPRPLSVFISVLFAAGLWVYGAVLSRPDAGTRGGYATLVCDGAYSDGEIRTRLDGAGFNGIVSESDQWFFLDCFGRVEKIPLAEYEDRLLPFDPRNDGYAEKLKSLFVRDGKRFVYIPLGTNSPENIEIKTARAMTGIAHSLEYARAGLPTRRRRDVFIPLIAICLASGAFFAIPVLRRRQNAGFLPCLPALSPLALGAAPGFALAALLAGLASLFAEPERKTSRFAVRAGSRNFPEAFTAKQLTAFALVACYCVFSFFSDLPLLLTFSVLVLFCCALVVSVKRAGGSFAIKIKIKRPSARRRRFVPVEIISRNVPGRDFFPEMLPFAVMALILAFAGPRPSSPTVMAGAPAVTVASGTPPAPLAAPFADAVTEADFREHFLFQSAFSYRTLGDTYEAGGPPPVISGYGPASNGLIEPAATDIGEEPEIPDFPLEGLLRGLGSAPPRAVETEAEAEERGGYAGGRLFALLPALFILPALLVKSRRHYCRAPARSGAGRGGIRADFPRSP